MRKILLALFLGLIFCAASFATTVEIATLQELRDIQSALSDTYIQVEHIAAATTSDSPFVPLSTFTGSYDGDGHRITDLRVSDTSGSGRQGLFGTLNGTVKKLGLENVNVIGFYAGSLAGEISSFANVDQCYSTGTVKGVGTSLNVGGFIGSAYYAEAPAKVTNSFTSCNVETDDGGGTHHAGTFMGIGSNGGADIHADYAIGTLTIETPANTYSGAGVNRYGAPVATFFDSTLCAAGSSVSTGKNTAEMKTQSTFTPLYNVVTNQVLGTFMDEQPFSIAPNLPVVGTPTVELSTFDMDLMENVWVATDDYTLSETGAVYITDWGSGESARISYSWGNISWDFTDVWAIDATGTINSGYPYLKNVVPTSSGGSGTSTKRKPIVVWWN